jgi:hypothetical protein
MSECEYCTILRYKRIHGANNVKLSHTGYGIIELLVRRNGMFFERVAGFARVTDHCICENSRVS